MRSPCLLNPVHHRLIKSDKEIERPDLAAVGVPGDLQIHPGAHRLRDLLGLMREKQHRQRRVGIGKGGLEIRAVPFDAGRMGGRVVDAGDDQLVTPALDDDVPVVQGIPADSSACSRASPAPR